MSTVVNGNNQFATNLYAQLKGKTSENLFFSPHSISAALAMTYAGAAGETQKQMAEVLHFTVPESQLHEAMARLRSSLLADTKKAGVADRITTHRCDADSIGLNEQADFALACRSS